MTQPAKPPATPPFSPMTFARAAPDARTITPPKTKTRDLAPPGPTTLTWVKESVAAALAVAIAVVSLWMLAGTYRTASEMVQVTSEDVQNTQLYEVREKLRLERKSSQKDILLIAIGLFGSVIGYYFGRVPAERRADGAESAANEAQTTATEAVESARAAQAQARDEQQLRVAADRSLRDTRKTLAAALPKLQPTVAEQRKAFSTGGVAGTTGPDILEASTELHDLLNRLN